MSELNVVALITAKPGSEDIVRDVLTTLVAATREEEGCISYDLSTSAAAPTVFVTTERWTGQEALDAHMATPHVATAIGAATEHLAAELAVHPLVPVEV